ncbi:MAG: hypothetical protein AB7T09_28840 [Planctomycetota bacterium]
MLAVCGAVWLLGSFGGRGLTARALLVGVGALGVVSVWAWSRRRLRRLGLVLASSLAALVLLELGLRQVPGPHQRSDLRALFQADAALGWRLRPGAEATVTSPWEFRTRVRLGARGFREEEPATPPGRPVVVLGDSFVTNLGVPAEEVFTRRLAALLGVPVLNRGVDGYGQVQERLLLDEVLREDRPGLVVLVVYLRNDLDDDLGRLDWLHRYVRPRAHLTAGGRLELEPQPARPPAADGLYQRLEDTCTHRLLRGLLLRARSPLESVPLGDQPFEARFCRAPLGAAEAEALALARELLLSARDACAAARVPFAVVLAPSAWQADPALFRELCARVGLREADARRDHPQAPLAAALAAADVPVLDLLPTLEGQADAYYRWNQHWTLAGNARVAEALAAWLRERSLVPAR